MSDEDKRTQQICDWAVIITLIVCMTSICVIAAISHRTHSQHEQQRDSVATESVELKTLEDSIRYFEDGY